MPTTNQIKLRIATSDGDPGGGDVIGFLLLITSLHWNCSGVMDLETNEIDEGTLCEAQDFIFFLASLDDLNYDVLFRMIGVSIRQSGDHGEAETANANVIIDYVYYDEGNETEPLDGGDDQQLRDIIARGSGFISVDWEWDDVDHN